MTRHRLASIALILAAAIGSAGAQSIPTLPRSTVGAGLNDSALFLLSDSARRTRAGSLAQIRKALSLRAWDSVVTTKLNLTGATITGAGTWSNAQTFASGQRVDSATGSARSQLLTTSRSFWGLSFNGSADVTGAPAFGSGATISSGQALTLTGATITGAPTWSTAQTFAAGQRVDSATGSARSQILTTSRTLWGQAFDGSANVTAAPTFGAGATVSNGQTLALGTATISGTPTWSSVQTFAATQRVDSSTGAARASALVGSPSITVSSCTGCGGGTTYPLAATNGAANAPSISFANSTGLGLYRFGADSMGFASGGVHSLVFSGGADARITGGAGSMNVLAGTGNSRRLVVQTTTSGGTATTAMRFNEVQQSLTASGTAAAPGIGWAADTANGLFRSGSNQVAVATAGAQSLVFSGGASVIMTGGAGSMTIAAGTGASRTITFQGTSSGSSLRDAMTIADSQAMTVKGRAGKPGLALGASDIGFYRFGVDTLGVAVGGSANVHFTGTGNTVRMNLVAGGPYIGAASTDTLLLGYTNGGSEMHVFGNTIMPGSGNSLTLRGGKGNNALVTLQATNSSGTATSFLVGNGDTTKLVGHVIATGLTSEATTQSALCVTNGGGQVFINAAATCTVSSRRFKTDIKPVSLAEATRIAFSLRPVSFTYKEGGQKAIGLVAEEADSVDSRLATRDAQGRVNSVNYEQVAVLLLGIVKDQQRQLDSLKKALVPVRKP